MCSALERVGWGRKLREGDWKERKQERRLRGNRSPACELPHSRVASSRRGQRWFCVRKLQEQGCPRFNWKVSLLWCQPRCCFKSLTMGLNFLSRSCHGDRHISDGRCPYSLGTCKALWRHHGLVQRRWFGEEHADVLVHIRAKQFSRRLEARGQDSNLLPPRPGAVSPHP